jgi:hypothetical protein
MISTDLMTHCVIIITCIISTERWRLSIEFDKPSTAGRVHPSRCSFLFFNFSKKKFTNGFRPTDAADDGHNLQGPNSLTASGGSRCVHTQPDKQEVEAQNPLSGSLKLSTTDTLRRKVLARQSIFRPLKIPIG